MYGRIREMRALHPAPVDTMGCAACPPHLSGRQKRLHHLLSLMMSALTKDQTTFAAMAKLREHLEATSGFTLDGLRGLDEQVLDGLIFSVGFHSRKAKHIKQTAEILAAQFDGDIPREISDMLTLPGVGPKMAYLLKAVAWGDVEGIGVDVHVHRLANMWGWVDKVKGPSPEKTRLMLEQWLPREYWYDINKTLVGFGQTICLPRGAKCGQCLIADMCGSAKVSKANARVTKRPLTQSPQKNRKRVKQEPAPEIEIEPDSPAVGVKVEIKHEGDP